MATFTKTTTQVGSFNLVKDARDARMSPSALMRKAYGAYLDARDAAPKNPTPKQRASLALLTEMQRVYRREYQVFLKAQRARLGVKRPVATASLAISTASQRTERGDIAPADSERYAVEQPLARPLAEEVMASVLGSAEMLSDAMQAVEMLRRLPTEMHQAVVAAAARK